MMMMILRSCALILGACLLAYTMPTDMPADPTTTPAPFTAADKLNEVITGTSVLYRLTGLNSSMYNPVNATHKKGFYPLFKVLQTMQTISSLQSLGYSSESLTVLRTVLDGILNDTCQWFKSSNDNFDCTDRSQFFSTILAIGLRPHVENLDCFLRSLDHFTGSQSQESWIASKFEAVPQDVTCRLYCNVHLDLGCNSHACSAVQ